jgi:hypothetical protein
MHGVERKFYDAAMALCRTEGYGLTGRDMLFLAIVLAPDQT